MKTLLSRGLTLATGVAVALAVAVTPAHAAQAQPAEAPAQITIEPKSAAAAQDVYGFTLNVHSDKAIAVRGASTAHGAQAIQWDGTLATPNNDYMWFEWQGGSNWYRIKPLHSEKCLATEGASGADNAFVNQYNCTYDTIHNDVWLWENVFQGGTYIGTQFRNLRSNKCLTVQNASRSNGARLLQYNCELGLGAPWNELWVVGNV